MAKPEFTHLELLAYTMYQLNNEKKGEAFVRWWCMRDDLREEYMAKVTEKYEKWVAMERAEQEEADSIKVEPPLFGR